MQFIVALNRVETYGNGASFGELSRIYGVSVGAVDLYTDRVMAALLAIENRAVKWPDFYEKDIIKKHIEQN